VPFVFFRYAITLLPVFALLQAWAIARWPREVVCSPHDPLLGALPDRPI
jgi:hypothetical protein